MYIKTVRNRATDDFRNFSLNLSLPAFKGEHCLWEPCPRQSVLGNRCRRTSAPLKPCTHVETRNRICIWVIWGGVGVWWGGGNNLNTHGLYGVHMGVGLGWGGGNNVHVNLKICHATLWDLLLHLHTYVMLRCAIFFRPGLFLAAALCLVFSNFDLNLLISTASRKHHPTQAPIGKTMGDNGETRPRKTDAPSSTGTHVGRHWETMKRNRRQRETGRQEGRQWEAIGWTMGDNGRQVETRPREHRQTRGDNTAGRRTHHPRLRHQPTQAHMWGDKGRQDLGKVDTPSNTGTHI